ncbi:AGE family epimerase/isomerase [Demequina sp.]|uniref:AGE family epimerase/isomerase n=1 Tax=Demequina sp. TaxID=2050685 RepID=UPI003D0D0D36
MPQIVVGDAALTELKARARAELVNDILPFWTEHAFDDAGWLRGAVLDDLTIDNSRPRHSVIAARTLWTFAVAARDLAERRDELTAVGQASLNLLLGDFWDESEGGVYWALNPDRSVAADRKQVYAQAFAIYGLAQWYELTGAERAREAAWELFTLLEGHARDRSRGGYLEALSRTWGPLENTALSDKDMSVPKSMNTNLHVLEAYTTLLRVTGDPRVREALHELLAVSLEHILVLTPFAHCELFFDADWNSQVDTVSYGHDIEASWLLWDAWEALAAAGIDDGKLEERTRSAALLLADAVRAHGLDDDGAVMYEGTPQGVVNDQKHWWPQAEGVVGWLNAFQIAGRAEDRAAALGAWDFIEDKVIDREHGEWFAELERDGSVRVGAQGDVKIGPWKCPYHNARACLEVMRRIA